jgi:HK97 gp10 family phage protein
MAGITLIGVNQLFADLDARAKDIEQKTDEAINLAGETCETEAKKRARVSKNPPPGHTHMRDRIKHTHAHLSSEVESPADYSGFNEFGTVKMSAQPFMRPGFRVSSKKLQQALRSI